MAKKTLIDPTTQQWMDAVTEGNIPLIQQMIEQGFDADTPIYDEKYTALMLSFCYGQYETAAFLIPHSNPTQKSKKGWNALDFAIQNKSAFPIIQQLYERLPKDDRLSLRPIKDKNPLMQAASCSDVQSLSFFLSHYDPNAITTKRHNALMMAIDEDFVEGVEILLPVTDLDAKDSSGFTAYQIAQRYCENEAILSIMDAFRLSQKEHHILSKDTALPRPMSPSVLKPRL